MKVLRCNHTFNYDSCSIILPKGIDILSKQKGHLFKILYENEYFAVQTPKAKFREDGNKYTKSTIELLYNSNDAIFISWIDSLQEKMIDLIFQQKHLFTDSQSNNDLIINRSDIANLFQSKIKSIKNGKFLRLKCNLHKNDGWEEQDSVLIYDENHSKIKLEDITSNDFITPLLVVEGILFTGSTFEIIFTLKQGMKMKNTTGPSMLIESEHSTKKDNLEKSDTNLMSLEKKEEITNDDLEEIQEIDSIVVDDHENTVKLKKKYDLLVHTFDYFIQKEFIKRKEFFQSFLVENNIKNQFLFIDSIDNAYELESF